ncbi:DUF5062 family protein [Algibacillus agarilyticus]|uniref:DUF5062 family protein n=1 Tax=Algibacillus agarilyticus TaxID=2234133 RepID=UPI000DD02D0A|nr:DUF5062 family protein [Algibacillus agarilyticus]
MKKMKNESGLLKKALEIGQAYAKNRGYQSFGPTDSAKQKIECIYRLLVNDKMITPLPENQEDLLSMKHKLAVWISKKLPENHPLLK